MRLARAPRAQRTTRWWRGATIALLLLTSVAPRVVSSAVRHDLHTAHVRLVIEGPVMVARIRLFRDDLQKAIGVPVADTPESQRAVSQYVLRTFTLAIGSAPLTGTVLDSGADMDGDQPVWWVLAQWKAPRPVTSLAVSALLLFETFRDQQNVVMVSKQPGDERRGLYFQAGDRKEQIVRF